MAPANTFGKKPREAAPEERMAPGKVILVTSAVPTIAVGIGGGLLLFAAAEPEPIQATPTRPEMFVTAQRAKRHSCAHETCGIVGELYTRTKVEVFETVDGWVRVTEPYHASCVNGRSEYVDSRNDQCMASNGIVDGQFAEWIQVDQLSAERPADPAEGKTGLAAAMAHSDDYATHGDRFEAAAAKLMQSGICTKEQLEASRGWNVSTNYPEKAVYFIFCDERRAWVDIGTLSVVKFED